jgi:hypothetical protein
MRYLSFLLILCSGTFVACGDPAGPETGGIALRIRSAEGHQARAEQGQVHVRGPTNTTVSIQRGETRTIAGLAPGSYTVALEGLTATNEVEDFAVQRGVQVTAGRNTSVTLATTSFVVQSVSLSPTTQVGDFEVTFGSVMGASRYVVEWDTDAGFASPDSMSVTTTSDTVTVEEPGRYYVRVRAISEFNTRGRPSEPETIDVIGPATQVTIETQPSASALSGVAFSQQPVVRLRDAVGNPVSQSGVEIEATFGSTPGGSPSLTNATATTDASGVATFSGMVIAGPVGDYTLRFQDAGQTLTAAVSATVTLSAGPPSRRSRRQARRAGWRSPNSR